MKRITAAKKSHDISRHSDSIDMDPFSTSIIE